MPATVDTVQLPQQGSHAHGKEGENEAICKGQEQGQIEEQGKDEETRVEIGGPPEEARDQREEEGRRQTSAHAHGGEAEEAAGGAQGGAESRADRGPGSDSCDGSTSTGAQSGACPGSDERRLRARSAGWHDGMNGPALIDMPNR